MLATTKLFRDAAGICYAAIEMTNEPPTNLNIHQLYETASYIATQPNITHVILDFRLGDAVSYVKYIPSVLERFKSKTDKKYKDLQVWFGPGTQAIVAMSKLVISRVCTFDNVQIQSCA